MGYLYHGTTLESAYKIIQTQTILAKESTASRNHTTVPMVSLSRDHRFSLWFTKMHRWNKHPVVIEIDAEKLSQTHRIEPYSYKNYGRAQHISGKTSPLSNQAEELIYNDITNIDRYITRIIVSYDQTWEQIMRENTKYPKLKNHPKLIRFEGETETDGMLFMRGGAKNR